MEASWVPDETFWRSRGWWGRVGQTSVGVWGANALGFLATLVASRALGPEEYGSALLAIAAVMLISTFLDLTVEDATVFHGNRALLSGDRAGLRALLRMSLTVDVGIGILVSGAIVALAAPLAGVISADGLDPTLIRLAALATLVMTADSTASAVLLLARRPHLRGWSMATTSVFRLVSVAVAVQFGGAEAVVGSYVVGSAAGSLVLGALAWRVARREWGTGPVSGTPPVTTWALVRFGLHSSAAMSLFAMYGSVVPVIIGATSGPAAVGVFWVAMFPVVAANTFTGPLRLAMFPELARLAARGSVEKLRRSVKGYTVIGFALASIGAVVAWIVMPWILPLLYSSKFDAAVLPARILLIAAVFSFALSWEKVLIPAVGRPQIRTLLAAIQLGVVAPMLIALGDRGAEGGAIAVSTGAVTVGIASLILARRLLADESLFASRQPAS